MDLLQRIRLHRMEVEDLVTAVARTYVYSQLTDRCAVELSRTYLPTVGWRRPPTASESRPGEKQVYRNNRLAATQSDAPLRIWMRYVWHMLQRGRLSRWLVCVPIDWILQRQWCSLLRQQRHRPGSSCPLEYDVPSDRPLHYPTISSATLLASSERYLAMGSGVTPNHASSVIHMPSSYRRKML